jgi:hypothetical protein
MNKFEGKYCWRDAECTQCYDKLSILLTKCLECSNGSKHCYEVYNPSNCYPFDDCSVCIKKLLRHTDWCKNSHGLASFACFIERPNCTEACKEKIK